MSIYIFGEWEHIFIGGMETYIYWGGEIFGGMNPPIPPGFAPLLAYFPFAQKVAKSGNELVMATVGPPLSFSGCYNFGCTI